MGSGSVRTGADFASIEAVFDLAERQAEIGFAETLGEYGIEYEPQLILRREISSAGRGYFPHQWPRGSALRPGHIGAELVDIHGQSDHLSVLRRDRQLMALDLYGRLLAQRSGSPRRFEVYARADRTRSLDRRTARSRTTAGPVALSGERDRIGRTPSGGGRGPEQPSEVDWPTLNDFKCWHVAPTKPSRPGARSPGHGATP